MTWKIEESARKPLTELDHTVKIPIAVELARLMVPHMTLTSGSLGEVVWTGAIADHVDSDLRYPSNPIDLIQSEGQLYIVTTAIFGSAALMGWVEQTLAQPMILQIPMRSCL